MVREGDGLGIDGRRKQRNKLRECQRLESWQSSNYSVNTWVASWPNVSSLSTERRNMPSGERSRSSMAGELLRLMAPVPCLGWLGVVTLGFGEVQGQEVAGRGPELREPRDVLRKGLTKQRWLGILGAPKL